MGVELFHVDGWTDTRRTVASLNCAGNAPILQPYLFRPQRGFRAILPVGVQRWMSPNSRVPDANIRVNELFHFL